MSGTALEQLTDLRAVRSPNVGGSALSQTERDLDVAGRARLIEWLKSEVVDQVSRLFKAMWDGSAVRIADSLAGLIAGSYILGRRLGVSYRDLDGAIADKLAKLKQEGHQLEDHYQDLSALEEHIRKR
ncbi:MazG-like family protein [Cohnella nanjingensis]|uniref:MazG-like family protein n=1 Tax=Cohnella nanjingensis TaxID=1387779 RepID=A0A7X0RVC8_9BACL|nr:MazG-like family protein [Cohnella nanjingensis]